MKNWSSEKDNLELMLLTNKLSYEEVGRYYNCTGQNIKKIVKKLGISIPARRKINPKEHFNKNTGGHKCLNPNCNNIILGNIKQKYCSNSCQGEYERLEKYKDYLNRQEEFVGKEIKYEWLKKIIIKEQNYKCSICGNLNSWNGKELHFILDHIDGDATNNKRSNLRLICPNCDSQLPTFKGRNIGKSTRKYKPYKEVINLREQ